MKLAVGAMAIVAVISGCTSSGLPVLGATQRYAYPIEGGISAPTVTLPTRPIASAPARIEPDGIASAEDPAPYDESKDPVVTAVLLPPVEQGDFLEDRIGPDGRQIILAEPARIAIIDVSDSAKVLAAANP